MFISLCIKLLCKNSLLNIPNWNVSRRFDEVEHPIIREALKHVGIAAPHLEITSMADIPAGTGLVLQEVLPPLC